jgi:hypothetical protein
VNINLHKKTNPFFINKEDQRKIKDIGIEQIHGHGSQRGLMPSVSVPAGCQLYVSTSASSECSSVQ